MFLVVLHDAQYGNLLLKSISDKWNALYYLESYIYDWLDERAGNSNWNKKVYTQTNTQSGGTIYTCNNCADGFVLIRNPKFPDKLCVYELKRTMWSTKLTFVLDVEVIVAHELDIVNLFDLLHAAIFEDSDGLCEHMNIMKVKVLPELLQNLPIVTSHFKVTQLIS
jgi:hypothetical protein